MDETARLDTVATVAHFCGELRRGTTHRDLLDRARSWTGWARRDTSARGDLVAWLRKAVSSSTPATTMYFLEYAVGSYLDLVLNRDPEDVLPTNIVRLRTAAFAEVLRGSPTGAP